MEETIYKRLATHLDNLPGGFPPTRSGVELRILKRLFTPEEAELTMHLTLIPEEPRVIARRSGLSRDEASQRLEEMDRKGLVMGSRGGKGQNRYMAAQFVVGIWEFHVNDLDEQLIEDVNEYIPTLFSQAWKVPQMRVIPVGRSLTPELKILPYEATEELVRSQKRFSVGPCICSRERSLAGEGCDKREERCLAFGMGVESRINNGTGREIDLQETLDLLKWADKEGLVVQPANAKDALWICLCCGCCCGILRSFKRYPKPAALAASPFFATFDAAKCKTCNICTKRCQMEAMTLIDGEIRLNDDRCIGCGLCVSTCPTGALRLVRKPESGQPPVPRNIVDSYIRLGKARGKISMPGLASMLLRSGLDRVLSK